jgi:hypothetical protein
LLNYHHRRHSEHRYPKAYLESNFSLPVSVDLL